MPFEPKKITKDNAALINLISKYKELIKTTHFEGEIYKWELTKRFHKRPNTNAPDFSEEISSIDFSNLIYQMGISVSKHIARERPEEFRKAFKDLFNESKDITLRTNRHILIQTNMPSSKILFIRNTVDSLVYMNLRMFNESIKFFKPFMPTSCLIGMISYNYAFLHV